jgi:tight adherence protein B
MLLVALTVLAAVPAVSQQAFEVTLESSELATDGTTALTIALTGPAAPSELSAEQITVSEGGVAVTDVVVDPVVVDEGQVSSTIMVLIDTSSSAAGEPIAAARDAATELAEAVVPAGVEMGLISFSSAPQLLLEPTDDLAVLTSAIADLEVSGGTALYDAITMGAFALQDVRGERTLVVFTDGADSTSRIGLEEALQAVAVVGVPIWNVALVTPDQDLDVLEELATRSDGQLIEVQGASGLSAAFETVAQSLTNRFVVSYTGTELGSELDLEVTVDVEGANATFSGVLLNPRIDTDLGFGPPPAARVFDAGVFGTSTALFIALGVGFVALLLFLVVLLMPRGDKQASRTLRRGLTMTERRSASVTPSTKLSASAIGQRALDMIDLAPKPKNYEERIQVDLDRAGWQLRSSEFIAMRIGAALGGLALAWALTGAWWFGLVAGVAGLFAPVLALSNAGQRRLKRFMEQLPDTLQLLAGTLRSGYAILQAIDTIVKETEAPMSTEFQRVLTEARLGLPLEDSLEAMAERVDSDDFRWVVVAMNIQRKVGGNLAELLETVSETLRGRAQTRRQIQVLSAEGKLSAIILVALPFLLLFYMLLTNPVYLAPLVTTFVGAVMSVGAVVLIGIGVFWMSRMIKIDV